MSAFMTNIYMYMQLKTHSIHTKWLTHRHTHSIYKVEYVICDQQINIFQLSLLFYSILLKPSFKHNFDAVHN